MLPKMRTYGRDSHETEYKSFLLENDELIEN